MEVVAALDRAVDEADPAPGSTWSLPRTAPSAAAEAHLRPGTGSAALTLAGDGLAVRAVLRDGRCHLELSGADRPTTQHRPRPGRRSAAGEVVALAVALTGTQVSALTQDEDGAWTVRARVDLAAGRQGPDPAAPLLRDPAWLSTLHVRWDGDGDGDGDGGAARVRAGGFGRLGLRDLRLVTRADGTAYDDARRPGRWLTATSAGPGFFPTAHTSVWHLDPATLALTHTADLFFQRPAGAGDGRGRHPVHGDHATHLLRDDEEWLVATSTWGDFDPARDDATVAATLARSGGDLLAGTHVLPTQPLDLPTDGLGSVGVWDPHLVRPPDGDGQGGWLVGYVSARRFFDFHPVVAQGPSLDRLVLRSSSPQRTASEGTTLHRSADGWRVLVSDGRDGPRGLRARHAVLDLDLAEQGVLDAPYPSNLPWPTLVAVGPGPEGWLLVTFDGTPHGGPVAGYGTHGDVVVLRGATAPGGVS